MLTSLAFEFWLEDMNFLHYLKQLFVLDKSGHLSSSNQAGLSPRIFKFTTFVMKRGVRLSKGKTSVNCIYLY
jgi:hypothetical protein